MARPKALHPRDDAAPVPHANWVAAYQNERDWVTIAGPGTWTPIYNALRKWKAQHTDELTGTCDTETRMHLS